VFIVSASGGQKPQFWQILTFLGAPVPTPFYRWGPNLVCYSRPKAAKNHIFGQILTFWGLLYRPPFTDEGQIWCAIANQRCTFTCEISSRSVYSVVLWRRKPPILPVFGLRHLVMSPVGINLRKLSMSAQLQTFAYTTTSKSFLYSNALMAKLGAH